MPNQKATTKPPRTSKQQLLAMKNFLFSKRTLVIILILVIAWIPYDLWVGGNIRFYSNWAKCGERPVGLIPGSGLFGAGVPHYYKPSTISLLRWQADYMCSAHEAELNGFSANKERYDFPNLKPDEKANIDIY